jgi:hypothetical protein
MNASSPWTNAFLQKFIPLMQNSPWKHELGTFLLLGCNAWIKATNASMCFSKYKEHYNMLKLRHKQARQLQFEHKHCQQDWKGHTRKWHSHDENEAFFHKNFPLRSIGPKHDQTEHIHHISHKLHARSQILITRSSQTPRSYLMSCQSHRAMYPLLNMRLLIGEHHATV